MDNLLWLADVGTNTLIINIWNNNWIILSIIGIPIGAILKSKCPEVWAKLKTAFPFIGSIKRR